MKSFDKYNKNLRVHNNKVYSYETDVADIDHMNRNILDYRADNLKWSTASENSKPK